MSNTLNMPVTAQRLVEHISIAASTRCHANMFNKPLCSSGHSRVLIIFF
jgi:hypothetical protein